MLTGSQNHSILLHYWRRMTCTVWGVGCIPSYPAMYGGACPFPIQPIAFCAKPPVTKLQNIKSPNPHILPFPIPTNIHTCVALPHPTSIALSYTNAIITCIAINHVVMFFGFQFTLPFNSPASSSSVNFYLQTCTSADAEPIWFSHSAFVMCINLHPIIIPHISPVITIHCCRKHYLLHTFYFHTVPNSHPFLLIHPGVPNCHCHWVHDTKLYFPPTSYSIYLIFNLLSIVLLFYRSTTLYKIKVHIPNLIHLFHSRQNIIILTLFIKNSQTALLSTSPSNLFCPNWWCTWRHVPVWKERFCQTLKKLETNFHMIEENASHLSPVLVYQLGRSVWNGVKFFVVVASLRS